ncbi:MAG TPA: serine/threonine-protein kinase, partial [Polyangiales bacterium]|nr:serine/threonine-protein kinase [Polyangiales bacterium]
MGRGSAHDADEEASPTTGDIFDSMLRKAARVDRFTLPAALPHIQQVIGGKYRIEHRLGRGGMGAVFRATHMVSRKSVALKWMLRSTADENAHRRFLREALAAGRIDHPNVVDVYDVGEEGPCAYLVMELLHGEALRARLGRGPLRPRQAATLLLPAMRGVSAAHRAGVIHRDLKPDNIFLCTSPDGAAREAKVLDFGIASVLDDERADPTLTRDGAVLGTPVYMSPEQLQGARDLDVRTDVYA